MRYVLLIYTNEADRPAWGTPEGDAEAKAYEAFHGEITQRGLPGLRRSLGMSGW